MSGIVLGVRSPESGPPADSWLVELEDGYRYRYWIIEINVTVESSRLRMSVGC